MGKRAARDPGPRDLVGNRPGLLDLMGNRPGRRGLVGYCPDRLLALSGTEAEGLALLTHWGAETPNRDSGASPQSAGAAAENHVV